MSDEKNLGVSQKLVSPSRSTSSCSSKQGSRQDSWEVVEGLRGEMTYTQEPPVQKGFLLKKRKWPLKGWHKRFFCLEKGILKYAKSQADIEREKLHGCIDVGLSVMSVKKSSKCIDLDTEEHIYHLKVPKPFSGPVRLHSSNPNLSTLDFGEEKSYSDGSEASSEFSKMQEDLCHVAHKVYFALRSAFNSISVEREKLKQLMELDTSPSPSAQVVGLKHALSSALAQNTDLKERLRRIHAESLLLDPPAVPKPGDNLAEENSRDEGRALVHQLSNESRLSITDSLSEFFDAQEVLLSPSSSENEISDDDSYVSDISDNLSLDNLSNDLDNERQTLGPVLESSGEARSKRRTSLPAPGPNTSSVSLWSILRNNIGKDLSKVAMPVELNEPLNTLQRLCEELEYSELLDKASRIPSPLERMVYVAAFAISAYASSYFRAGSKPFNPVLGETYECIRQDKGFQFFAEQVSHHPPISACHAESGNFVFWQDVRWKNKFWGKSMEIVPIGTTHVTLPAFGDHFEWNKVTSCIHNILSGQRWIEHYGEIDIKNLNDDSCHCKVNFIKAKYWSTNAHEIEGTVFDRSGKAVHRLFGKWHESIYCGGASSSTCVWRANPMPKGYEQYYGFTQFALELNEMDPLSRSLLPPTDTRFRPDQRLLEEGNIEEAEVQKQRIEKLQRERRRVLEENGVEHQPRFFRKSSDDAWVSNGTYLELRKDLGFSKLDHPVLW
ncbi:oxysterol-binding protein-related protein 3 isoform X4 [Mus musculus]|nr:oxysterol-binding protein-related protein 3 isoform X4 [Mus musculus]|eukprot:XP_006506698.1 PREDICTED: oxysterol-binding protein-related protein 3 isoform X4 [Mus musculus]